MECEGFDPCGDYGEGVSYDDFHGQRIVTAKKKHKCGECSGDILPGNKYEYIVGASDGDFFTHKTCSDCLSIVDAFFSSRSLRSLGGLFADLDCYLESYDPGDGCYAKAILKTTDTARTKVQEVFERVVNARDE